MSSRLKSAIEVIGDLPSSEAVRAKMMEHAEQGRLLRSLYRLSRKAEKALSSPVSKIAARARMEAETPQHTSRTKRAPKFGA